MRTALMSGFVLVLCGSLSAAPVPAEPTEKELQDKLKKLNQDVRTEEEFSATLKELFKDKKGTAALVKAGAAMQKAKGEKPPFRFYPALALGRAAQFVKNHEAAELFYTYCTDNAINDLQSGKLIAIAGENLLDFYWDRKKYDKVQALCEKLLGIDGDETLARFKILVVVERHALTLAKLGETDKALEQVEKLIKAFDGNWEIVSMKAQVLREAGKTADALKVYETVIEKVAADDDLKEDDKKRLVRNVKYAMSGLHMEADAVDKSADILQALIKESPDQATYYNDLGFIWADHDLKLEESEKLIRKAIELDLAARKKLAGEGKLTGPAATKANAAYIDSLGWVLYKRKKYDEAIGHLLEAAQSDDDESDHIEIWDHVGDCYAAMGKKKEALDAFQKGMKADDVTKKDIERRRKVAEKIRKLKAEMK